jgi:hypothetical protein
MLQPHFATAFLIFPSVPVSVAFIESLPRQNGHEKKFENSRSKRHRLFVLG